MKYLLNYGYHINKKSSVTQEEISRKLDKAINDYKKFFNFCKNHNNKSIIKYEFFITKEYEYFKKVFDYFEKKLEKEILELSIDINKKIRISENFKNSNRFSSLILPENQNIYIFKKIDEKLKDEIEKYSDLK